MRKEVRFVIRKPRFKYEPCEVIHEYLLELKVLIISRFITKLPAGILSRSFVHDTKQTYGGFKIVIKIDREYCVSFLSIIVAHCGLMTPFGNTDLSEHCSETACFVTAPFCPCSVRDSETYKYVASWNISRNEETKLSINRGYPAKRALSAMLTLGR